MSATRTTPFYRRILLYVLLPTLVAGVSFAAIATTFLTRPLFRHLVETQEAQLQIASYLTMTACETNFNYLLDLRLENDLEMASVLQKDSLEIVNNIPRVLPKVETLVLDAGGLILVSSTGLSGMPGLVLDRDPGRREVLLGELLGERVHAVSRFFPFWDWQIVVYMTERDFFAPVHMARRIVYWGTFGVFATMLVVFYLMFRRHIDGPLKRLIRATRDVAEGRLERVHVGLQTEIGRLSASFNEMVAALETKEKDVQSLLDALRLSEGHFRTIFQTSPDAVSITGFRDGVCTDINEGFTALLGYEKGETVGRSVRELGLWVSDEDRLKFVRELDRQGILRNWVGVLRRKDGSTFTTLLSATLMSLYGKPFVLSLLRDISELARTEASLRESEERYRVLTQDSLTGIYIHWDGVFVFANPRMEEMLGYEKGELLGRGFGELVHPEDRCLVTERARDRVRGTPTPSRYVFRALRKDGETVWLEVMAKVILYGGKAATMGNILDITDKRHAEAALRESEEKYRLLVENATDAVFIVQEGRIRFPNPVTTTMTGYTRETLEERHFLDFVVPEDRDLVKERHEIRLAGGKAPPVYSFRIYDSSGRILWVQLNAIPVPWEGRPAVLCLLRDITRLKSMEEQLLHAQKMEAIGTLAGGIAHDFNNILMGIQGNVSLMLRGTSGDAADPTRLGAIQSYVRKGANLTKQLLGFARGGRYEVKPTDLNGLLSGSAEMFGRTHKEIPIHYRLTEGLWAANVDRGQIEQVLLNLYMNAWQAMPQGGDILLESENLFLDEAEAETCGLEAGPYVSLSVSDTGSGIEPRFLDRIFDPFFTTKPVGQGTGLGLASAYGILRNHGGAIRVKSALGRGSSFTLLLPASREAPGPGVEPKTGPLVSGSGTLLLIDDEETVRDVAREMLETLGYKVLTAASGEEGLHLVKEDLGKPAGQEIALVILDMIMPGLGGEETFLRLRAMAPRLRILLASGYSLEGKAQEILAQGCQGFIQKPFGLEELAAEMHRILGGKETPTVHPLPGGEDRAGA